MGLKIKFSVHAGEESTTHIVDLAEGQSLVLQNVDPSNPGLKGFLSHEAGGIFVSYMTQNSNGEENPEVIKQPIGLSEKVSIGNSVIQLIDLLEITTIKVVEPLGATEVDVPAKTPQLPEDLPSEASVRRSLIPPPPPPPKATVEKRDEDSKKVEPIRKKKKSSGDTESVEEEVSRIIHGIKRQNDAEVASSLPPVEDIGLLFDFKFRQQQREKEELKESPVLMGEAPSHEPEAEEEKRPSKSKRTLTRDELLKSDLRDRRLYTNGRRYSLRNKISFLASGVVTFAIMSYAALMMIQVRGDKLEYVNESISAHTQAVSMKLKVNIDAMIREVDYIQGLVSSQSKAQHFTAIDTALVRNRNLMHGSVFRFVRIEDVPKTPGAISMQTFGIQTAGISQDDIIRVDPSTFIVHLSHGSSDELLKKYSLNKDDLFTSNLNLLKAEIVKNSPYGEPTVLPIPQNGVFTFIKRVFHPTEQMYVLLNVADSFVSAGMPISQLYSYSAYNMDLIPLAKDLYTSPTLVNQVKNLVPNFKGAFELLPFEYLEERESGNSEMIGRAYGVTDKIVLVTLAEKSRALAGLSRMFQTSVLYALVCLIAAVVLGTLFSKTISRPLVRLTAGVETVASGNYFAPVQVKTNDEVGVLADYFEFLSEMLKEKDRQLAEITELAAKDTLTGLFNHVFFLIRLRTTWKKAQEAKTPFTILLIDIDYFRVLNGTFGHKQGDQALRQFADKIRECIRPEDSAYRYSGSKFAVLMPGAGLSESVGVAEKIRLGIECARVENLTGGPELQSTCSVGLGCHVAGSLDNLETLIEKAQESLYLAKEEGRNTLGLKNYKRSEKRAA